MVVYAFNLALCEFEVYKACPGYPRLHRSPVLKNQKKKKFSRLGLFVALAPLELRDLPASLVLESKAGVTMPSLFLKMVSQHNTGWPWT